MEKERKGLNGMWRHFILGDFAMILVFVRVIYVFESERSWELIK